MAKNNELRGAGVVFILLGAVLFLIVARMVYLSVLVAPQYSAQAKQTRTVTINTAAKRGTIYDRNGTVLAASVDATTVYCNPTEISDEESVASVVAECMGGKASDYLDALTTANTTFAYIKRQGDVSAAAKLKEKKQQDPEALAGIYFLDDARREYPNGQVAGQIIGICDVDGNGICGLELEYDELLKGENGEYVAEQSMSGTEIPGAVVQNKEAKSGQDIMISIDVSLQAQVEDYLKTYIEKMGKKGSATLMDASTGEIYAMCSYPYLNPSKPSESESGSDNVVAITQASEPGSTMKSVTALGLLQAGVMGVNDAIYCPNYLDADEYTITDAWTRGDETMTLDEIITQSSNIGISLASDRLGAQGIYENLQKSKILEATGVDYPGEAAGYVQDVSTWSNIGRYNITFGQGISVSGLSMCRFYGAVCNNGVAVTPHFLLTKTQTGETFDAKNTDLGYSETAISDLKTMLRDVVNNNEKVKAGIDGYDVCGKTATAEYSENGKYVEDVYNIGFAGFINNASIPFVCNTQITQAAYGNNTTELFRDIMKAAIEQYSVVSKN